MVMEANDPLLRTRWFYTADGPLYSVEGKKKIPTLWLTREPQNLVLRHLDDDRENSYLQLTQGSGNFFPDVRDAKAAMKANDTLRINLTRLRLQGNEPEWRRLEFAPDAVDELLREERMVVERVYGRGETFARTMKTFQQEGIPSLRIYMLNPDYVRENAVDRPLTRAAWCTFCASSTSVFLDGNDVVRPYTLVGKRKK